MFPESSEVTLFSFEETYLQEQELELGRGYWLRFNSPGNVLLIGTVINEWIIELQEGWNLIGGVSQSIAIEELVSENDLIIPGTVFEFTSSYENAEVLLPGKGYWLKTVADGFITLSSQN